MYRLATIHALQTNDRQRDEARAKGKTVSMVSQKIHKFNRDDKNKHSEK